MILCATWQAMKATLINMAHQFSCQTRYMACLVYWLSSFLSFRQYSGRIQVLLANFWCLEVEHLGKRPLEERVTSSQLTILLQSNLQIFLTVSKREVPVLDYKGKMAEKIWINGGHPGILRWILRNRQRDSFATLNIWFRCTTLDV